MCAPAYLHYAIDALLTRGKNAMARAVPRRRRAHVTCQEQRRERRVVVSKGWEAVKGDCPVGPAASQRGRQQRNNTTQWPMAHKRTRVPP